MPDLLTLAEPTYTERVRNVFLRRPNQWIAWHEIAAIGGAMAWRSRISDVRRRFHMAIECKVEQREDGVKVSWYRWVTDGSEG